MKKIGIKMTAFAVAITLMAPVSLLAQDEKGDKEKMNLKEKTKKDVEQIIITRTNKDEKMIVEINGDKVTINGKPIGDYKDKDGNSVSIHKFKSMDHLAKIPGMSGDWNFSEHDAFGRMFTEDANRAMLGVTTDESEEGAEINSITKESAAEKMGLKEGDIITKVDDKMIDGPEDLTSAIKSRKPGDKVTITYLRDKKEQKATAELSKWKSQNFKMMDMGDMNMDKVFPRVQGTPRVYSPNGQNWSWSGGGPKLGLSVQDTDEGKGVKVIEVDEESNAAKAGIKKEDVVTEVDGKAINSTDDMVKMIRESKEKTSIMIKLQRAGKVQNIEVKIPRKIKTVDM